MNEKVTDSLNYVGFPVGSQQIVKGSGVIDKLAPALVAFQGDLIPVEKSSTNPFFKSKYADLPTVMSAVQPILAAHKLAVTQFITHLEGGSALRTILMHESGQYIEDVMPLLLAKQDPQGQGSAITYARRYSFMSVLGIVADEDDDGNKASMRQPAATPTPKKKINSPTGAQMIKIKGLFHKCGVEQDVRDAYIAKVTSYSKAEDLINQLEKKVEDKKMQEDVNSFDETEPIDYISN
ncbi:MAG TPA: ERF family protein [Patescibacteria group bacterium]|jgi:hypothetical protein|nr:ERF family protein [Patescibacteria group bacterium]